MFVKNKNNKEDFALLKTVGNDIEAVIIQSLLEGFDIPVWLHYSLDVAGAKVIIGKAASDVEIYVPKELYGKANEIIVESLELGKEE